jgi:Flp pilus assembly pilin Flp
MSMKFLGARKILTDRRGVTALEYGIVAAALTFVFIISFAKLGVDLGILIGSVGSGM